MDWARIAMKFFIGAVIIAGFFGPYIISIVLGSICLAAWAICRHEGHRAGK